MAVEWCAIDEQAACKLYADASAALSIATRQGAGKMRHINVRSLWLQERSLQKVLQYEEIKGEDNPSDGLTKHVRQELAQKYAITTHMKLSSERVLPWLNLADQR